MLRPEDKKGERQKITLLGGRRGGADQRRQNIERIRNFRASATCPVFSAGGPPGSPAYREFFNFALKFERESE